MVNVESWIDPQEGNWSVGGNWNNGVKPGTTSIAYIQGSGAFLVDVTDGEAASLLTVNDSAATLDVSGTLAVGTTLTLDNGTIVVVGYLSAPAFALAGGTLDVAGTIRNTTVTGAQGLQLITGSATLDGVSDAGVVDVPAGAVLTIDDGSSFGAISNQGSLYIAEAGANLGTNSGVIELVGASSVSVSDNTGTIIVDADAPGVVAIGDNTGTIIVDADAPGGLAIGDNTGGTIVVDPDALVEFGSITLPELGSIINNGGHVSVFEVDLRGRYVTSTQLSALLEGATFSEVADGTLADVTPNLNFTTSDATVFTNGEQVEVSGTNSTFITSGTNTAFGYLESATVDGLLYDPAGTTAVGGGLVVLGGTAGGNGTIVGGLLIGDDETLDNALVTGSVVIKDNYSLELGVNLVVENTGTGGLTSPERGYLPGTGVFTNNGTIDVGPGAFLIDGAGFTNNGVIIATQGTLSVYFAQSYLEPPRIGLGSYIDTRLLEGFQNNGTLLVSSESTLSLDALVTCGNLGTIEGSDATLVIVGAQPSHHEYKSGVFGAPAATLDLGGATLDIGEGYTFNELDLQGVVENGFLLNDQGYVNYEGGSLVNVTLVAPCFAAGTRIACPRGSVSVEQLREGNMILTAGGACVPVRWVGRRHVDCRQHERSQDVWPVRIAPHAFGPGRPARPLRLSPDHAVYVDGILVPVRHLLNGHSIVQLPVDTVTYHHVELPAHDIILAEGLPCESYLDTGNRENFVDGAGPFAVHPDFVGEAIWESAACAPLRIDGDAVAGISAGLCGEQPGRAAPHAATTSDLVRLLQPGWYVSQNTAVARSGLTAMTHYRRAGRRQGLLPCPAADLVRRLGLIDPATAASTMGDVVARGHDTATHFCDVGWREGRRPNLYFDTGWYLDRHDVPAGMNPLLHYILRGELRGLPPSRHFDPAWYRQVHALGPTQSPLAHYLAHRRTMPLSPLPSFDVAAYVHANAGTLRVGRDPYAHFLVASWRPARTRSRLAA